MAYPSSVDDLSSGIPSSGTAATTPLGSVSKPHRSHHAAVATAVEAVEGQLVGGYDTYTPTLTADTVDPTLGSGSSATGRYKRLGHRVVGDAVIVFGSSGTAAGTGGYGVLLPVEPANRVQPIGIGYVFDYSDSLRFVVASAAVIPSIWASSTKKAVVLITNTAGTGFGTSNNPVGAAVPWTWSANDQLVVSFSYEAASAT